MNFKLKTLSLLTMAALSLSVGAAPIAQPDRFVPKRLLVQAKPGLPAKALDKILEQHGAKRVGKIEAVGIHIVELPTAGNEKAVAALLAHNPHLQFAEVDSIVSPNMTPTDNYFPNQWHHKVMNTTAAWDISQGAGVTIAILDTGVDPVHPDYASLLVPGWNFYDNNSDTSDVYGHGSKVAGTASALANNGGVVGMSTQAKIMPIRISDPSGYGSWSAMANGIVYAADHGAKAVNMSYAAAGSASIQSAADYLKSKGGLLAVSAGNYGTMTTASASDSLISISATDSNDVITSWSSFGNDVDFSAPGAGVYTTNTAGGYCNCNGTSFSAPIATGTVALMMSANPALPPDQIVSILKSTAKDLGTPGYDIYYGHGRIDAGAAVAAAKAAVVSDTSPPVVAISSPSAGATIKGIASVSVTASDNTSVSKVEMLVDGALLSTDYSSPFEFLLDTSTLADGAHSITVTAYDPSGNKTSSQRSVNVMNAADTVAPVVSIASPSQGAVLGKSGLSVSASASDNVGVASMTVSYDGTKVASSTSGSISYSLPAKKVTSGSHTVVVVASDAAGNSTSKTVTFTK